MANRFDAIKRFQLLIGWPAVFSSVVKVAVDEFDGFENAARRLGLPDFAESTPANSLNQPVTRQWLRDGGGRRRHGLFQLRRPWPGQTMAYPEAHDSFRSFHYLACLIVECKWARDPL